MLCVFFLPASGIQASLECRVPGGHLQEVVGGRGAVPVIWNWVCPPGIQILGGGSAVSAAFSRALPSLYFERQLVIDIVFF